MPHPGEQSLVTPLAPLTADVPGEEGPLGTPQPDAEHGGGTEGSPGRGGGELTHPSCWLPAPQHGAEPVPGPAALRLSAASPVRKHGSFRERLPRAAAWGLGPERVACATPSTANARSNKLR